jgi:hypothetical protein
MSERPPRPERPPSGEKGGWSEDDIETFVAGQKEDGGTKDAELNDVRARLSERANETPKPPPAEPASAHEAAPHHGHGGWRESKWFLPFWMVGFLFNLGWKALKQAPEMGGLGGGHKGGEKKGGGGGHH